MSSFLGAGGGGSGLTVGTTTITGGSNNFLLYDNSGVLGERNNPYPLAPGGSTLYYVSTTGSDSNDGLTVPTAFATLQHAVNVASAFDFGGGGGPNVQIENGTYTISPRVSLPSFLNVDLNVAGGGNVTGDISSAANAANVLLRDPGTSNGIMALQNCSWTIAGVTLDTFGFALHAAEYSFLGLSNGIGFEDHTGIGDLVCISCQFYSIAVAAFFNYDFTINLISGSMQNLFQSLQFGAHDIEFSIINYPAGGINWTGNQFQLFENCFLVLFGNTYNNTGGITGDLVTCSGESSIYTPNGLISDFPGTPTPANCTFDPTCSLINANSLRAQKFVMPIGYPFTHLSGQGWGVFQDTLTTPQVAYIAANLGTGEGNFAFPISSRVNLQTANYTLDRPDMNQIVEMNLAGANTVTVPPDGVITNSIQIGEKVKIVQVGVGATTIVAGVGVTGHNFGTLAGQWASATLYKRAGNEWVMIP